MSTTPLRGAWTETTVKKNRNCRDQIHAPGPAKSRPERQNVRFASWDLLALAVMYQLEHYKPSKTIAYWFRMHFNEYVIEKESRQDVKVTDSAINQRPWRARKLDEVKNFKHLLDPARDLIRERCGF